jgi:hypothetical protein
MAQSKHHTPMPAGGGIHPISSVNWAPDFCMLDNRLGASATEREVRLLENATMIVRPVPEINEHNRQPTPDPSSSQAPLIPTNVR